MTPKPAQPPGTAAQWTRSQERANLPALRIMAWIALHLGRTLARWLLHPITLYFLCFAPTARRQSGRYLTRALGRPPTLAERYRHLHAFAAVVLDRVWFVSGRTTGFDIEMSGQPQVLGALAEGRGAFLIGAHVGSFEALQAVGHTLPGLRVAMVMYPDNARMIQQVLAALAPQSTLGIIALGRSGSTLAIRDWLDSNGLIGILGDRLPPADTGRLSGTVTLPFLGAPAAFSDGPMRLALLLRRQLIFMAGLYHGGRHYAVRFEEIADFRQPPDDPAAREAAVQAALAAYVARLEQLCREAPFNWFNFYDYWQEDAAG